MNKSQSRRMWIVVLGLLIGTFLIIFRLINFQIIKGPEWAGRSIDESIIIAQPARGTIYDRNGAMLAANSNDYQISVSPNMVVDSKNLSLALMPILSKPQSEIMGALISDRPHEVLAGRVSVEVADLVRDLQVDYGGLQIDPLSRRFYPQDELLCHTLGYVDFNGDGGAGLEGLYQEELAGEAASATVFLSPLREQPAVAAREGSDLVLTIDRSVQRLVEQELAAALQEHRAESGTIIVMDPRTGAILAMASAPCYDPYEFYDVSEPLLLNPAISNQFEPGSVMKLITMAAALDAGVVTPASTYYDAGGLEVGGHRTVNWDRSAPGTTDMTTLLARSLNVGAATLSTMMGAEPFNDYLRQFGFGSPTGIDLMSEAAGTMPLPGDELWTESFLATYAYGQSIATTPLQMITALSALANDGEIMQPYLVQEVHSANGDFVHEPTVMSKPISAQAARDVTAMAVTAVSREVAAAQISGYTIAGKTGTAQIAENGVYLENDVIGTFVGWLPADAPEVIVYVKLDRPQINPWGSMTAAPTFANLAEDLVVLLGIPPDNVRLRADMLAAREN